MKDVSIIALLLVRLKCSKSAHKCHHQCHDPVKMATSTHDLPGV